MEWTKQLLGKSRKSILVPNCNLLLTPHLLRRIIELTFTGWRSQLGKFLRQPTWIYIQCDVDKIVIFPSSNKTRKTSIFKFSFVTKVMKLNIPFWLRWRYWANMFLKSFITLSWISFKYVILMAYIIPTPIILSQAFKLMPTRWRSQPIR